MAGAATHHHHHNERCQSCAAQLKHRLYCDTCEKIQQLGQGDDYFSIFGHPRTFKLDPKRIEKNFEEMMLALHPDFYANAEAQEQTLSLEHTALLNEAKNALFNPYLRGRYLLTLLVPELGTVLGQPPQTFILETFALQEALDEAEKGRRDIGPLSKQISKLSTEIEEALEQQFGKLTEYGDQPELVEAIRAGLSKLKFLINLRDRARSIEKSLS
ncbi:MAG: Fe-S protein assembly co-chaperone HscB [Candidatus Lambdaproteobacteria bacterium RIFOXYD2_FULL_50_16]|uniref:Fe-S protein assembly co-chaperone HscB n=1 Tax=Candidatus Lambdaproteobacteria bacterium RIFOXYD2_FULL_50_16 TaxID=1817772 RepID=A0A1F6GFQ1_9PROT|nr:MAG: Fe-S protein assembly co-chaperone HscB [Candidatus Lambdaproteobacteria bacterium RIFOXYD2_FULL_50_16]